MDLVRKQIIIEHVKNELFDFYFNGYEELYHKFYEALENENNLKEILSQQFSKNIFYKEEVLMSEEGLKFNELEWHSELFERVKNNYLKSKNEDINNC